MGECFDSDGFDYKEAYYRVLSELNDKRGLEQHSRALFWSRLFACYQGGCLPILIIKHNFSGLEDLLFFYGICVFSGILLGGLILFLSGVFKLLIEGAEFKVIYTVFGVACLAAPLVLLFIFNHSPEP